MAEEDGVRSVGELSERMKKGLFKVTTTVAEVEDKVKEVAAKLEEVFKYLPRDFKGQTLELMLENGALGKSAATEKKQKDEVASIKSSITKHGNILNVIKGDIYDILKFQRGINNIEARIEEKANKADLSLLNHKLHEEYTTL